MKQLAVLLALPLLAAAAPIPKCTGCFPPSIRTVAIVMPGSILHKAHFDRGVAMLEAAGIVFGDITPGGPDGKPLSGDALAEGRAEVQQIKKDFAAKVDRPVWDGYPYGHVPLNCAIDFLREVSISADGVLRQ